MPSSTSNSDQKREFKILLRRGSLFGAVLLIILVSLNILLAMYRWDYSDRQFKELTSPQVKADLVIFGNSTSFVGINPRYLEPLGHKVFNFAFLAACPDYYITMYDQIFRTYYPKPKLIIYGTDCMLFDPHRPTGRHFLGDCEYFPWPVFLESLRDPYNSKMILLINRFPILKARGELRGWIQGRASVKKMVEASYNGNTPILEQGDIHKELHPGIKESVTKDLDTFLGMLEKDGIPVVVVQTPAYLPGMKINDDIRKHNEKIASIARKHNMPFLDYNGDRVSHLNETPECFALATHLNQKGSIEFSKRLCSDMAEVLASQPAKQKAKQR